MSPELLSAAVTLGETLVGLNLSKGQFSKIFLGGGVFSRIDFSQTDFRGADLVVGRRHLFVVGRGGRRGGAGGRDERGGKEEGQGEERAVRAHTEILAEP